MSARQTFKHTHISSAHRRESASARRAEREGDGGCRQLSDRALWPLDQEIPPLTDSPPSPRTPAPAHHPTGTDRGDNRATRCLFVRFHQGIGRALYRACGPRPRKKPRLNVVLPAPNSPCRKITVAQPDFWQAAHQTPWWRLRQRVTVRVDKSMWEPWRECTLAGRASVTIRL